MPSPDQKVRVELTREEVERNYLALKAVDLERGVQDKLRAALDSPQPPETEGQGHLVEIEFDGGFMTTRLGEAGGWPPAYEEALAKVAHEAADPPHARDIARTALQTTEGGQPDV